MAYNQPAEVIVKPGDPEFEFEECLGCGEMADPELGEMVVVGQTWVDHMMVSEEREFLCSVCVEAAEEASMEQQARMNPRKYWRYLEA